jgi:hypothetical protein
MFSLTFSDLAAHQEKIDSTLVRHGTPVEKHCSRSTVCNVNKHSLQMWPHLQDKHYCKDLQNLYSF